MCGINSSIAGFTSIPHSETIVIDNDEKTTCIYAKILGRHGMMKLGAMCCYADIINYGNLPYTDFIRTQTLCQGGEMCDFRFVRHPTDAGDGWERTKSI